MPPEKLPGAGLHMRTVLSSLVHFITLTSSQIVNCLHEWQSGAMVNVSFTAERYAPVYDSIMEQFNRTLAHPYHGIKVRRLLQQIANEAQYVNLSA